MSNYYSQEQLELTDYSRRFFGNAVWIPLRASQIISKIKNIGDLGYHEEFFSASTVAINSVDLEKAKMMKWEDVNKTSSHGPYFDRDEAYVASEIFKYNDLVGINLVLDQFFNTAENREWHINQDLILALNLKREGDLWVSPAEGYETIIRLHRDAGGEPVLMEIKAEFLKDYLCARGMHLIIALYRSRRENIFETNHIKWENERFEITSENEKRSGHYSAVHEGGAMPFGSTTAILKISRTDIDPNEDVPTFGLPSNEDTVSERWEKRSTGRKIFFVEGRMWRTEWINPGLSSPRVRGDKADPVATFITEASGKRESRLTLNKDGRWLWFKPDIAPALLKVRGSKLIWYTKYTGRIGATVDHGVHFGFNDLGLINVYANDISYLPDWEQLIWSAYNVSPNGGVSKELQDSQVRAEPSQSSAPERFLIRAISKLKKVSEEKYGKSILINHKAQDEIISNTHRFRALNKSGLYELAKDVARLTADSFDAAFLNQLAPSSDKNGKGSLKALERLIEKEIGSKAKQLVAPLFAIYDLRLGDAHLPKSSIDESFVLLEVDSQKPLTHQAERMLSSVVTCLYNIITIIQKKNSD